MRRHIESLGKPCIVKSVLKALPGRLDIKRHSPSILYIPEARIISKQSVQLLLISANEMRVESVLPVIIRSNIKWEFLDLGGWHCLQHIEVTNEHIEVHCLNEPIVQSARYLILKEANMSGSIMEQLLNGLWSISLFSIGGNTLFFV